MTTQENSVEQVKTTSIASLAAEVGEPVPAWNFDIFVDDRPLWLATKVRVENGKMFVQQFLNDSAGMYNLRSKKVRVAFYTNVPSILMEAKFQLGLLIDMNLSCDGTDGNSCATVEAVYECKFTALVNHCETKTA